MPTRTLMSNPNRACTRSLSAAIALVMSSPAYTARCASFSWAVGMAEHRQQPVALGGPDVAFVVG